MLEKLDFYVAIDFFLNDTARHADIVLPGTLQEEDEGTVTQIEGRVIKINKAVDCPGEARQDWRIIQDIARALGRPHGFTFEEPRQIFDELRRASKGGVADYSGITYEKIEASTASSGPATTRIRKRAHPSTTRARRDCLSRAAGTRSPRGAGPFYFPDGKARFNVAEYRPPVDDASEDYPDHPDDGTCGEPVPVRHADPADRPARGAVPGAARRDSPAAGRAAWGSPTATG